MSHFAGGRRTPLTVLTGLGLLLPPALGRASDMAAFPQCAGAVDWSACFDRYDKSLLWGYYKSKEGGMLAWGESYVLNAYMTLYHTTGNPAYLDKFAAQADELFRGDLDPDGDGVKGWPTPVYSAEKAVNGGFETTVPDAGNRVPNGDFSLADATDPTLPQGWTRRTGVQTNTFRSTAPAETRQPGNPVLVVRTAAGMGWQKASTTLSVIPFTPYAVTFWGRSNGKVKGRVEIQTGDAVITRLYVDSLAWAPHGFTFIAPSTAVTLSCYTDTYGVADGLAVFDDVMVKDLSPRPAGWRLRVAAPGDGVFLSTAAGDAAPGEPGARGLVLVGNGTAEQEWTEQPAALPRKNRYQVNVDVRAEAGGLARVEALTGGAVVGGASRADTVWTPVRFVFEAPAGSSVTLRLSRSGTAPVHMDNVSVKLFQEFAVHDGMILYPLARFVRAVRRDPALASHATRAEAYRRELDGFVHKWDADYRVVDGRGYLQVAPSAGNNSAVYPPGSSLPHNQTLGFARFLLEYAALSGDADALAKADAMARGFKFFLAPNPAHPGAWLWRYGDAVFQSDPARDAKAEDAGHANIDVSAALLFQRAGRVFNRGDLTRFVSTRLDVMRDPARGPLQQIADRVDGSVIDGTFGRASPEWVDLSGFDRRVWEITRDYGAATSGGPLLLTLAGLAKWAVPRPANPGFEEYFSPGDADLPAGWTRWQATPETAYRSTATGDAHEGQAGLVVKTKPGAWQVMEQHLLPYVPGTGYRLTFWGKVSSPEKNLKGRVDVATYTRDGLFGERLGRTVFSNETWAPQTLAFTAPTTPGTDVVIRCYYDLSTATGTVVFDDFALSPLAAPATAPAAPASPATSGVSVLVVPNPLRDGGRIRVTAPGGEGLRLQLFDLAGRAVWRADIAGPPPLGMTYDVPWNAAPLPTGVYFLHAAIARDGHTVHRSVKVAVAP